MAQLPPMHIDSTGARMPKPTPQLLTGLAKSIAKAVERYSDEIGKHGCMLGEIPEVWETAARAAFAYIAVEAGTRPSPIKENPPDVH